MEAHETEEDLDDQFDSMIKMNDPFLEILIPEGEPSIYSAIRYGDDDMVKRQIHEGVDLNRKFEGGIYKIKNNTMAHRMQTKCYSVLHLAALHSSCQVIETLLDNGSDIDILDEQHRTSLHFAIVACRTSVIKLLIAKGANIDVQSSSGRSPLLESVINGSFDIAKILIEAGAQLDLVDTKGTSVLHQLSFNRDINLSMIQLVLEKKGDPNIKNHKGGTPLMFAASLKRHFSVDLIKLLLQYGADINLTDNNGRSAIHFAVEHKSTFKHLVNILFFLIQHGASINTPDKSGKMVLDHAIKTMALSTVKCLLKADCPRNVSQIMESPNIVYLCEQVPDFKHWLMEELYQPRSLMRLCRGTLRDCLSPANLTKLHLLDIPRQLQDFLLCKDLHGSMFS
ncbi:ankyrin repeat domain-containing protein 7-like [Ruditapes philippinarum]|uniref:ankyrin repeat domain-containing protein 7-like n=1 Tax=Ruditapes philippinarum TaxID=129788 RepID=UPI00295B5B84|nr:ankyrin repeat domain-containing protein 7-like [Ruditapes philippinarum]XP_060608179.1 ankyrin repeat domain-containing protein 7-like [Ruditapes philippinarum]XP_060608180.1 ankyrin repeat domain-containing protein 7-like [Ruditapes philippinarum]